MSSECLFIVLLKANIFFDIGLHFSTQGDKRARHVTRGEFVDKVSLEVMDVVSGWSLSGLAVCLCHLSRNPKPYKLHIN